MIKRLFFLGFIWAGSLNGQPLPKCFSCAAEEIVRHKVLTISYNERHEQANYVCYMLTPRMAKNLPSDVPRSKRFLPDPLVRSGSAIDADYRLSGYDRGHLAPAEDMDFDSVAMQESFYFSNIVPQNPQLNRNTWRRLEARIRSAAIEDTLWVYTGAILNDSLTFIPDTLDRKRNRVVRHNHVSVAHYLWKMAVNPRDSTFIVWLVPNADFSFADLADHEISLAELEKRVGLRFPFLNAFRRRAAYR